MSDLVNHPAHYEEQSIRLEPIDFCERLPFCLGNTIKYCFRAGHKEGASEVQDLKKALWYLKRQSESHFSLRLSDSERHELSYWYACFLKDKGVLGATVKKYYETPVRYNYSFWTALQECIENRIKVLIALEEVRRSNPVEDKNDQTDSRQK